MLLRSKPVRFRGGRTHHVMPIFFGRKMPRIGKRQNTIGRKTITYLTLTPDELF